MASFLPPYMQQDPIMSGQRKGTSRTAPQSMSSLLSIFNQMPQFQGIGEAKIRDLFAGSIASARLFGQGQGRINRGERGAAPSETAGIEEQKRARLARDTELPMLKAIMGDMGMEKSYLAQLLRQLMQSASGPISESSDEATQWRAPTAAEINPQMPMVKYPSQGGGGGGFGGSRSTMPSSGVGSEPFWGNVSAGLGPQGPREIPDRRSEDWWSRGAGAGTYTDEFRGPGGYDRSNTGIGEEAAGITGGGLASTNLWGPTGQSPENPPGGGPSPLPSAEEDPFIKTKGLYGMGGQVRRSQYAKNPSGWELA